jgi:site-specific DNA recombinase
MKQVALYARVSTEEQARGDAVSIDGQLSEMRALCERNGWEIIGTFIDSKNYRATQQPNRGKMVSPSGERADRPQFLEMLEVVKSGAADVMVCWRDDRLVRHPRVFVAIDDAIAQGDQQRRGDKITITDATGAMMDIFTLSIKASVWREENKRRAERSRMGKIGVLERGRWPGKYTRLGYVARRAEGERGCIIELGDPAEIQTVKDIFNWYDKGISVLEIRKKLIRRGDQQKGWGRVYDWEPGGILKILRAEDYTGVATWKFADKEIQITIPAIISNEQWQRVQKRIDSNRALSSRNASQVFVFHHLLFCGECGGKITARVLNYYYTRLASGKLKRYEYDQPRYQYYCSKGRRNLFEHSRPLNWKGQELDNTIWRYLVDNGIKRPDFITEQVKAKQQELIKQGDSADSAIHRARQKLAEIEQERAFYQRQAAKGFINESEFEQRMNETQETAGYWQAELTRLEELRADAAEVQAGLDYVTKLLQSLARGLAQIDLAPEDCEKLSQARQDSIMKKRQEIARALCDRITIFSDGRIIIDGLLDGSECQQFDLPSQRIGAAGR